MVSRSTAAHSRNKTHTGWAGTASGSSHPGTSTPTGSPSRNTDDRR